MAEDYHKYWQRKSDERIQERRDLAAATKTAPLGPEAPETRSFGFRSGAARGLAEGRTADLARAGTELGSPTSYAGGAGAPASIGVIRGMKQTYAQDTGGPQLQEFATPQQAGQAWNRRQLQLGASPTGTPEEVRPGNLGGVVKPGTPGVGGYDPVKGPEIREEGRVRATQPDVLGAGEERKINALLRGSLEEKQRLENDAAIGSKNVSSLKNYVTTTRGLSIEKDSDVARDTAAAAEVGLRAGPGGDKISIQHFNERQAIRAYLKANPFSMPEGYTTDMYLGALAQNPAAWAELVQEGKKKMVSQPQVAPGTAGNPGTAMQQLGILGRKMTPDWMTPGYYERTHPK